VFIPISALLGDNVVEPSENTPWYHGPALLDFLENVQPVDASRTQVRFPVQVVIRPHQDYRGFAGRLESGTIRRGDTLRVASTGLTAVVESILVSGVEAERAESGDAVSLTLDREVEVSRGDLLYDLAQPPQIGNQVEATLCWMDEAPLELNKRYVLLQGPRRLSSQVERIVHRLDIESLEPHPATDLNLNEIGKVILRTVKPLAFDPYSEVPGTGSFVLVDPSSHATVAGGMLERIVKDESEPKEKVGKVIQLIGFGSEAEILAKELRRFGESVVVLSNAEELSDEEQLAWSTRLATQQLHVLLPSSAESSSDRIRLNRNEFSQLGDVVEQIIGLIQA
jgi:sulfate adenylyltransferase subunit 1 (EFTu-like GTPase family)